MSEADQAINVTPAAETSQVIRQLQLGLSSEPRTLWGDAWRRFRRHKLAMIGASIFLFFCLAVTVGPPIYVSWYAGKLEAQGIVVPPRDRNLDKIKDQLDFLAIMSPPSAIHPFGTDELGRDLLGRAIFGGRVSLAVGVTAMLIAITIGTLVGACAGFFGGTLDQILMRITDLFLSLPTLPLLLLTVYLFREPVTRALGLETGIFMIVVTMVGALAWMSTARIVRATFLTLKEKEFVEAAIALGISRRAIMFRHILPNALSPIIVAATLEVGNAIIQESTLSFLGIGFPPDTPTWGRLVTDGSQFLQAAPHLALIPGVLIFLTVLSINFMGDGLRDALDPRSRL
jgi:peptide/nickel transport system permease protein